MISLLPFGRRDQNSTPFRVLLLQKKEEKFEAFKKKFKKVSSVSSFVVDRKLGRLIDDDDDDDDDG